MSAEYYRQAPPKVPNFYNTLFRRKLVLWFLFTLVLRDYWLSGVGVVDSLIYWDLTSSLFLVIRKELVVLVGQSSQGLASSDPYRRLLCRRLGCPPYIPHLAQQDSYVVPRDLCGWHRCPTLVSGR